MKSFAIIVFSTLFWVWLSESVSLYYTKNFSDGLDKAKVLLDPHPGVGWMQKPHYQGTFIEKMVHIDGEGFRQNNAPKQVQNSSPFTILTLGPSSAFGWGVEDHETYSSIVEKELSLKINKPFKVINASQIGFSSFQGRLLINDHPLLKTLKPDLVLFAYGVNDIDRHRFFFQSSQTDSQYLKPEILKDGFQRERLLNSAHSLRLFNRKLGQLVGKFRCPNLKGIPLRRVSLSEFLDNLRAIKNFYQAPLIIVNTANAYKSHENVSFVSDEELNRLSKLIEVKEEMRQTFLKSKDSHKYYKLAEIVSKEGKCAEAHRYLSKALELEEFRIAADLKFLNTLLESDLGLGPNVFIIDAYSRLHDNENRLKYFVDPIHPNKEGHHLMALDIMKVILDNRLYEQQEK